MAQDPVEPVECHSGSGYAEYPTALHWEGARLEVAFVITRYRTLQGKGFRVLVQDGREFELLYNESTTEWQIIPR